MALHAVLPEEHLSAESRYVVKLGMGLIAPMTALVLGLLIASAKSSFDTQRHGLAQLSANVVVLDRTLARYGTESKDAREMIRASVADMLQRTWPEEGTQSGHLVTVLFAYLDWWTPILDYVGGLHVQISLAGYLVPSVVLLVLGLATFLFYDPMRYMVFTPGQVVVHKEIGDLREVFDTTQVEAEKRRTDLFRHWILGFGAGDLIIKVPSQSLQIELPNVLFVGSQVTAIANLMKTKPVLSQ
jgi:hypothetical protein